MEAIVLTSLRWPLVVLLLLGISSALFARISQGTRLEAPSHRLFFVFMGLVGMATFGALLVGPGHGLLSGTALSLMSLVAVWDCSEMSRTAVS